MSVRFTVLGSGSGGNCAFLEAGETRILVDAGFSARQIRQRLASIGRAPEGLAGILVTHEHSDHIQGLGPLCARLDVPVFCNRDTRDAIQRQFPDARFRFQLFETGADFELGDVGVQTFSVPHDAMDPVGFVVETGVANVGFVTDLGHATKLILERIRQAHVLVLEANYDVRLLQEDTRRPWSTKQRIQSRHGHLSNDAAALVAAEIAGGLLRQVYLGHLSRDCNRPELARKAVARKLQETGASHVILHPTSQDEPSPTLDLGGTEAGPAAAVGDHA